MIDYTDVDAKLEEYSEAFDFYMECGEMPPTIPPDDCLAGYMQVSLTTILRLTAPMKHGSRC